MKIPYTCAICGVDNEFDPDATGTEARVSVMESQERPAAKVVEYHPVCRSCGNRNHIAPPEDAP